MVCLVCFTQKSHLEFIIYLHMLVVVGEKNEKNKNQERTKYINLIGIHKSSF